MFLVERLTSRSSVALSVSIGYARSGGGRRAAMRTRGAGDDAFDRVLGRLCFPSCTIPQSPSSPPAACTFQSGWLDPAFRVGVLQSPSDKESLHG
jgi:hypothetical protein